MGIDACIIVLYLIIILMIGVISSRKLNTIDDFAVSNVKYGKTIIFITMCCSFLGGGFSFGNATEVFKNGIGNIFVLCGFSIGQILIGKYIVSKIDKFKGCISTGTVMQKIYGKKIQIVTGLFATVICSGILGAQVSVMGNIFQTFMKVPSYIGVIIGFGIVLIYSTMGGIKADIITDIVQFIILIIGIPVLVIYGFNKAGGLFNTLRGMPIQYYNILNNRSLLKFISMFFALMLGEMLIPPYVQRLLIGKNVKDTAKATIMSGYISILFFVLTGFVGIIAYSLNPNMAAEMAMTGIIKEVLPVGLSGIIISAMMAIVLSTADSFLNSAAVSIINDIYIPLKDYSVREKDKLKMVRIANIIIGVLAVLVALFIPNLLDILTLSYSFWAPTILPILLITLLGLKLKEIVIWNGIFAGFTTTFVWDIIFHTPFGIDGLIIGFVVNILISVIMQVLSKSIFIKLK